MANEQRNAAARRPFAVALYTNAAACGVVSTGIQKQTPGVMSPGRSEFWTPSIRGPRGGSNTSRATCTEGTRTNAHTYQSDGGSSPGRQHKHTSAS